MIETTFDKQRTELIVNLVEQKKFSYIKRLGINLKFANVEEQE